MSIAGIESRGFLVAAPLALRLGIGFIMVRKHGKLPGATVSHEYALEYGSDTIEIQDGAVKRGDRVVVLDYGRKLADGSPDEVRGNQDVIDAYLGVSH